MPHAFKAFIRPSFSSIYLLGNILFPVWIHRCSETFLSRSQSWNIFSFMRVEYKGKLHARSAKCFRIHLWQPTKSPQTPTSIIIIRRRARCCFSSCWYRQEKVFITFVVRCAIYYAVSIPHSQGGKRSPRRTDEVVQLAEETELLRESPVMRLV